MILVHDDGELRGHTYGDAGFELDGLFVGGA